MRMPPPANVMIYTGTEFIIIPDITSLRGAVSVQNKTIKITFN